MTKRNPFAKDLPSKAPSSPMETTAGLEQRPDHTGVIRPADEAEDRPYVYAFAIYDDTRGPTPRVRRVMALADAEQAALTAEVERLELAIEGMATPRQLRVDLTAAHTEIRRMTAQRNEAEATNTPHNDPEFGFDKTAALSDPGWADPCLESCGGQSWTGVNTNYGHRWRCDTCGRNISRYVTDAIQRADDRRSL
jgi:hypothetical protein